MVGGGVFSAGKGQEQFIGLDWPHRQQGDLTDLLLFQNKESMLKGQY
jgi:hypothetical protein